MRHKLQIVAIRHSEIVQHHFFGRGADKIRSADSVHEVACRCFI